MFTGIVTHIGRVAEIEGDTDLTFVIESDLDLATIDLGASVSHSGVCLTVTAKDGNRHQVQASSETLRRTTIGDWTVGTMVNLETSLTLGDELGGHIVFGHVDGLGKIVEIKRSGDSHALIIEMPKGLENLVAEKGSISVDGISLTVNGVEDQDDRTARISLMIIPHSWANTTLQHRQTGDYVNIEADMLARYVARQIGHQTSPNISKGR